MNFYQTLNKALSFRILVWTLALFPGLAQGSETLEWQLDESVGYILGTGGNKLGYAEIVITMNGTKQVVLITQPIQCSYLGRKNSDGSYITKSELFLNDLVIQTKLFTKQSANGCSNKHFGLTTADKNAIVKEFRTAGRVVVEYGDSNGFPSKFRGRGVQLAGGAYLNGEPILLQVLNDASGNEITRPTLAPNSSRYFLLSTEKFNEIWKAVK
jgi:hypothetical protein